MQLLRTLFEYSGPKSFTYFSPLEKYSLYALSRPKLNLEDYHIFEATFETL